jgi:hypothetical protein
LLRLLALSLHRTIGLAAMLDPDAGIDPAVLAEPTF